MTTNSSHADGSISEAELQYLSRRCESGFGLVVTSCAYVDKLGIAWRGIGAASDAQLKSLRRTAETIRAYGSLSILQLYDGGRLCPPSLVEPSQLRAPSAIASSRPGSSVPREMSSRDIQALLTSFQAAAARAVQSGFDGVELHGANHYLIHQFFSPRSNQRNDAWGGDSQRRMAFPLRLVGLLRETLPKSTILGFRITPFEAEPRGYTLSDALELCKQLADLQVDYIHVSLDNLRIGNVFREIRSSTQLGPLSALPHPITEIANCIGSRCAVIGVGGVQGLTDAQYGMEIGADLIAVGRAALIDPDWLSKIRNRRESEAIRRLPRNIEGLSESLSIPAPMIEYILGRPGWIPRA